MKFLTESIKKGAKVYKYNKKNVARCPAENKTQKYKAYIMQGFFGLVDKDSINEGNYKDFVIYPIVAVQNNLFGMIDKTGKQIFLLFILILN